jgi:hypothetical protein
MLTCQRATKRYGHATYTREVASTSVDASASRGAMPARPPFPQPLHDHRCSSFDDGPSGSYARVLQSRGLTSLRRLSANGSWVLASRLSSRPVTLIFLTDRRNHGAPNVVVSSHVRQDQTSIYPSHIKLVINLVLFHSIGGILLAARCLGRDEIIAYGMDHGIRTYVNFDFTIAY